VAPSVAPRATQNAPRDFRRGAFRLFGHGAAGGIRTPNLLIRSQMLYPLSYGCNKR
jgi:hypothetical protein